MYSFYDKREAIRLIQKYISRIQGRNDIRESGIYDEKTRKAVMEYQKSIGHVPDGVVKRETWERMYTDFLLKECICVKKDYKVGDYGDGVKEIKALLRYLKEYYPDIEGFDDSGLYTESFGDEVNRIRKIMGMGDSPNFDTQLYNRIKKELEIRKNNDTVK